MGRHQFSLGRIGLFLSLVLAAAVSLRGASRVVELLGTLLELPEAASLWPAILTRHEQVFGVDAV
ncbi:MAG: hypothetical protein HC869_11245 [Rhodospirillales bacterium]|nr:hypothetical protein [Rhodospirillales bacterium]